MTVTITIVKWTTEKMMKSKVELRMEVKAKVSHRLTVRKEKVSNPQKTQTEKVKVNKVQVDQ